MEPKPEQVSNFSVLGRSLLPEKLAPRSRAIGQKHWMGDRRLAETTTDGFGRFLLEWSADVDEQVPYISVRVFAPWGDPAGEIRLTSSEILFPSELTFSAVLEPSLLAQAPQMAAPPSPVWRPCPGKP
jgi:hypothetical protein